MISWLLSSPDHTLQNVRTALHVAAMNGKTETVNLLLGHKADINAVDEV